MLMFLIKTEEHKDAILRIPNVGRDDKGMYQCFVRNDQESAQGEAELKLGGRCKLTLFENCVLIETEVGM